MNTSLDRKAEVKPVWKPALRSASVFGLKPAPVRRRLVCVSSVSLVLAAVHLQAPGFCGAASVATDVKVVSTPAAGAANPFYVGNREPLLPSPLVKLPIGSITPKAGCAVSSNWKRAG